MIPHRLPPPLKIVLATAGVVFGVLLLVFGWRTWSYYRAIKKNGLLALPQFSASLTRANVAETGRPDSAAVERGDHPSFGPLDAPLTVVVFADFECPFSKEVFPTVRAVLAKQPSVRYVFRNFPLDAVHPLARRAAAAAHCADAQGKFWQYHDKLFQNAPKLEEQDLYFYAEQIGLDVRALKSCMADPATSQAITDDLKDGVAAGVRGTPTFFFNGQKVEGAIPFPIFRDIISKLAAGS